VDREGQFEDLYRSFYPRVVSYLNVTFRFSREDAADLAQEVFIRLYESIDEHRGEAKWSFVKSVTKRVAFNVMRERYSGKERSSSAVIDAEAARLILMADTRASQEDEAAVQQMTTRLAAAVDALPPTIRSVLLLRVNEFSYAEIARDLGISMSAVKSRLHAARVRLREELALEPFVDRLEDDSLSNVVAFPSPPAFTPVDAALSRGSDEEAARQLLERVAALDVSLRHMVRQLDEYRRMLVRHDERIVRDTVPAVAAVRSS
jgi:RNA polymerase sigma-70 factor, ECF subfamily